ncbi:hypothetical protein [Paenibacillus sp.]|uniref:hypothetical protein n=1 Tax=Paenibacillus sp. TaxID=58172 RepID=UPI002D4FF576|nr:hypothetical protein [Paenibacillus sp.]HZG88284.1 hypothetical protein [Paenibacillus sp.]
MRKWFGGCLAASLAFMSVAGFGIERGFAAETAVPAAGNAASAEAAAEPTEAVTDDASSLVQQGLTIHELDKELARLKAEEADVNSDIGEKRGEIERQKTTLDARTAAAGRVLRAYYMGQRDRLWLLLFEMKSLNEALVAIDYLQAIVTNDFKTLREYRAAYVAQQERLAELTAQQERLRLVIAEHEKQRVRLVEAQTELDRRLAELTEQEREIQLGAIAAVTEQWEKEGLPLFEDVLSALSTTMRDLPELLEDPSLMSVKDGVMEIRIPDTKFNAFLKERNELFEHFEFAFGPEGMTVAGGLNGHSAELLGAYTLEHEPVNSLRFTISSLTYNGYELPDTTKDALQNKYDLAFEPGRLLSGLTVSDLANEDGLMRVKLSFSLASGF